MSIQVESNADEWAKQIGSILSGFGFHSPTDAGPMGDAIVKAVAAGISARGLDESRGYDREFDRNEDRYLDEKIRDYLESRPNVRTRQMLSPESVEGEREVAGDGKELTWRYGTGRAPSNARTNRDRTTTDRQKAKYAHDGPSGNNDRPFFGYTPDDELDARAIAEDALDRHLKNL